MLVSRRLGHQPTQGGTQQQGAGGRSRSLYLDCPVTRSISHFRGGAPDFGFDAVGGCDCDAIVVVVYCIVLLAALVVGYGCYVFL